MMITMRIESILDICNNLDSNESKYMYCMCKNTHDKIGVHGSFQCSFIVSVTRRKFMGKDILDDLLYEETKHVIKDIRFIP